MQETVGVTTQVGAGRGNCLRTEVQGGNIAAELRKITRLPTAAAARNEHAPRAGIGSGECPQCIGHPPRVPGRDAGAEALIPEFPQDGILLRWLRVSAHGAGVYSAAAPGTDAKTGQSTPPPEA